jgi:hypothetical protein
VYNAIGGSGDELYGVEDVGYYIKNLFLNVGIAWPLAAVSPVLVLRNMMHGRAQTLVHTHSTTPGQAGSSSSSSSTSGAGARSPPILVLFASALLWLIILFRRAHKVSLNTATRVQHSLLSQYSYCFRSFRLLT